MTLIKRWLANEMSTQDMRQALKNVEPGSIQIAVVLSSPIALHDSCKIPAQSFRKHSKGSQQYVNKVEKKIAEEAGNGWIDAHLRNVVVDSLGEPPMPSCPLYFITAENGKSKKILYVGRTSAETGRFENGHVAITKLHAPKFGGFQKNIYMASVLARIGDDIWVNLELVTPGDRPQRILKDVELQLIFLLKPKLNTGGKLKNETTCSYVILFGRTQGIADFVGKACDVNGIFDIGAPL